MSLCSLLHLHFFQPLFSGVFIDMGQYHDTIGGITGNCQGLPAHPSGWAGMEMGHSECFSRLSAWLIAFAPTDPAGSSCHFEPGRMHREPFQVAIGTVSVNFKPVVSDWYFPQLHPAMKFQSFQGVSLLIWVMVSAFQSISDSAYDLVGQESEPRIPVPYPCPPIPPKLMWWKQKLEHEGSKDLKEEATYWLLCKMGW